MIQAFYFDGKSSRRHVVELAADASSAWISGDVSAHWPLSALRVSARMRHGSRKVTCPDGAYLEIHDTARLDQLLAATGYRESVIDRVQQSWRASLAALLATLLLVFVTYQYGLPAVAQAVAFALPEKVERAIGRESLNFLDQHLFKPSTLSAEQRAAIVDRFRVLTPPRQHPPTYEILFRQSLIGPNAFALPSGQIVLTDQIVDLMSDDQAINGILAHELGHLHQRHLMRRLIQGSLIGALATVLFGDASAAVANLPTILIDMKYSRDAEREADDYAIALFKANGLDLEKLALVFEKLGQKSGKQMPYVSTHPEAQERVERIRAAR